jgi:hypothetical protein
MKNILTLWIKDKIHLTIWLLCLLLIGLSWSLFQKKTQWFLNVENKQVQIMAQVLISSLVLNIALCLSYIRSFYKNQNRAKEGLFFSHTNGCWHTEDKKQYFCPKCLDNKKRSPLKFSDPENILNCTVCSEKFTGTNYRETYVS